MGWVRYRVEIQVRIRADEIGTIHDVKSKVHDRSWSIAREDGDGASSSRKEEDRQEAGR